MAAEEGAVIPCHTKDEFETQMAKAKESGKLGATVTRYPVLVLTILKWDKIEVIIDFTASWCGPCRFISPVFAELAKKYLRAIFLKVDVDELKEVAEKYSVEAMPTFLFIKDGEKVDSVVGAKKEELKSNIEKHIGSASA